MQKYIFIAIPIILIVIAVGILVSSTKPSKPSVGPSVSPTVSPKVQPSTLTGLEIAKKTATFLDNSTLPSGDFTQHYLCKKEFLQNNIAACQPISPTKGLGKEIDYRSGYIALAYLDLFTKTQDASYRDKANNVMARVLRKCANDSHYCLLNITPLYYFYKNTNDSRYKDAMVKAGDELLKELTLPNYILNNRGGHLQMLHEVTGDIQYLTRLEEVADKLLAGPVAGEGYLFGPFYTEGGFAVQEYMLWVAGDWYIPAYKATQNPKYLVSAQEFFDKAKIHLHVEDFKKRTQAPDLNGLEYLLDMAEVSSAGKKAEYVKQAQLFGQAIVLGLWDSRENKKFTGDNAFLFFFNTEGNQKMVLHSAWRIRQFLKLSDQIFEVK